MNNLKRLIAETKNADKQVFSSKNIGKGILRLIETDNQFKGYNHGQLSPNKSEGMLPQGRTDNEQYGK